jgi:hypothetical protein
MKTIHTENIADGNRYIYDFDLSSTKWAQVDTPEDASYYGIWVNPFLMRVLTFVEGDTTILQADSEADLTAYLRRLEEFYKEGDRKLPKIDPGFNDSLRAEFVRLGLEDMMH